ncbi:hypothetical protein [Rhizobium sp. R339]|uniref:DUF7674 family protein n=1 Tax=Rhizobium sp. R339 TaxID=1764273 RepID=UPI001FD9DCE0|nr:hypothetical protein [Rhizobium sp. R339]
MFEPLLEADPSFREKWERFQNEYRSEDELPLYLALSDFARHLIENLETGNTLRFDGIFDVVERWHVDGDPYVQEAATIGLLEDLQNTNLHREKTCPEDFLPWLRPATRVWWARVHEFWGSDTKPIGAL